MNKSEIKIFKKYPINKKAALVILVLFIILLIRFLIQNNVILKPIQHLFNFYADFLIFLVRANFYFFSSEIHFDFVNNEIINSGQIIRINRFFFSANQIVAVFVLLLITKSPIISKLKTFIIGFILISVYNSIRISLHILYPETIAVHHWFFNLVLIPRWLIVLIIIYIYWSKYPSIIEMITNKFNFSASFINHLYLKIGILIISYYIVIIIAYNELFFINGTLLISFILNLSKNIIELLGYDCWINNRLIYGNYASLYMDDACLGINLMFLFASFILLLPGSNKHKLWYIPLGLFIIVLLNVLRVVLIFINMSKSGAYTMAVEIHDLFTYPVLVFTFFMWVIWLNRFFKLKLTGKSKLPDKSPMS